MDRRTLLKRLALMALLPSLWRSAPAAARVVTTRVRPGEVGWPSAALWQTLKEQVGGNLLALKSPLPEWNAAAGTVPGRELLENLSNPYYVGDQPALTEISGWLNAWNSAPSAYAVAARNSKDVAAAVTFARENNVRLVVKGGGHSYQGTSNAPDSLLVWTRQMNRIDLHDAFVADGCEASQAPQPAVTIEAGALWMDAYNAVVAKAGRYVQGGGCATVGVAGLIQSGGFGSFSKRYGMAAASLLQAEIVTADGTVRRVNAQRDPELFWALKGGGGGTFGVVTNLTLRTHELPEFFGGVSMNIKAASDEAFHQLIARFLAFYRDALFNPHWGESVSFRTDNTLNISLVFQDLTEQQAIDIWRPFLQWIRESKAISLTNEPFIGAVPARGWWDPDYRKKNLPKTVVADTRPNAPDSHVWWKSNQEEVGVFVHGYHSAWLPAALLKPDQQVRLGNAIFAGSRHFSVDLHFNKGLAGAPRAAVVAARDTTMNPDVLDAFALAIIAGGKPSFPGFVGHEPDLNLARSDAQKIDAAMNELRRVVPNAGSYVSESNYFERSWQHSFWGSNYPKLARVKAHYDPHGLFVVHHGVGDARTG